MLSMLNRIPDVHVAYIVLFCTITLVSKYILLGMLAKPILLRWEWEARGYYTYDFHIEVGIYVLQ